MIFLPRNTFCTRLLLSDNRILMMFVLLLSFRNDYSATLWVQFCLFALPWLAHFDRNWCLKLNCSCKYPGYSPFQNFDIFVHLWKRFCAVKKLKYTLEWNSPIRLMNTSEQTYCHDSEVFYLVPQKFVLLVSVKVDLNSAAYLYLPRLKSC